MDNIIAKNFQFALDVKATKVHKEKSFACYNTDALKFTIDIMEDGGFKEIGDAGVEVIYSYPNGEATAPIKQTMEDGGISVDPSGILEICPKSNCLIPTDYLRVDINVYDEDEFITLQPFVFRVLKSVESEIYEKAETVVNTMRSIDEQMDRLSIEMEELKNAIADKGVEIEEQVTEMASLIQEAVEETQRNVDEAIDNTESRLAEMYLSSEERLGDFISTSEVKINNFVSESNNVVDALMEKIEGANIDLEECFLRSTPLTPFDYDGKILFATDFILGSPYNLIGKTYILSTTGSPVSNTIISTNIAILYFTLEGEKVVIDYTTLANKSIQGKAISITPQFNNLSNSISIYEENFRVQVMTNLLVNHIDNAKCTISANTSLGNRM